METDYSALFVIAHGVWTHVGYVHARGVFANTLVGNEESDAFNVTAGSFSQATWNSTRGSGYCIVREAYLA